MPPNTIGNTIFKIVLPGLLDSISSLKIVFPGFFFLLFTLILLF